MEEDRTRRRLAELGLVAMVLIWGVNFAVVKAAFEVVEPLTFNALRHVLASLFLIPVLLAWPGRTMPRREDVGRVVVLGFLGSFVYQFAFVWGLERTRAGNAALMLALVPVFLLLVGGRNVERGRATLLGVLLSVAGVALVSGGAIRMDGSTTLLGDLLVLGAAAVWAVYTVGAQPLIERYGPVRTTAWTLWVGSLGLVIAGIPSMLRQEWSGVGAAAWGGIVYSGVLSIGLAYLLWYQGVQVLGGARTATFANLPPVVALAAGWLWLGEMLTVPAIAGAAMVLGGVLLVRSASAGLTRPVRS